MPLASQERVEGVSRFGRDWVAIGRDLRTSSCRFVPIRSRFDALSMPGRCLVDTEDKVQRRQNVAKNGTDLGASVCRCLVDALSMSKTRRKDGKTSLKTVLRSVDWVAIGRDWARFGRDWVAIGRDLRTSSCRFVPIRSRFGRDSVAIGRDSVAILSRFCRDSVAILSRFGRVDVEDKAQRRQNVAKNGTDLGAWRRSANGEYKPRHKKARSPNR